jgi:membrane protein YdbS with pleckstrin-like domain
MYEWLKRLILPWLRVEDSEPHPPAGHDPYATLRIERADAGFLRLRMLQWRLYAVAWGAGIALASVALIITDWRLLLLVIPLVALAVAKAATLYVTMRLDYEMRWYVITDRSLLIREGVWNVQEITLTFANAQNVRVTQGPLERWFGFSNVEVETAGGGGGSAEAGSTRHRARLRGLANPQEVRSVILEMLRKHRTAGLGDPDDVESRQLVEPTNDSPRIASGGDYTPLNPLLGDVWAEARALREVLERGREQR